jgi:hypothetical protein
VVALVLMENRHRRHHRHMLILYFELQAWPATLSVHSLEGMELQRIWLVVCNYPKTRPKQT